jgi:hypothetical protein
VDGFRVTAEDIIRQAHRLADTPLPSDSGRSDAPVDWVDAIDQVNNAMAAWHDMIAGTFNDALTKKATIKLVGQQQTTALPDDFLSVRVIYIQDAGTRDPLEEFELPEMVRDLSDTSSRPMWRIMGSLIYWDPLPDGAYDADLWYIQQFARLEQKRDEVSPRMPNGWEAYPIGHYAQYLFDRQEMDPAPALRLMSQAGSRIQSLANRRLATGSRTSRDATERFRFERTLRHRWRYPIPRTP